MPWIYTESGVDKGNILSDVGFVILTDINWSIVPSATFSTTDPTCTGRPNISLHSKGASCWKICKEINFEYASLPNDTDYEEPYLLNYKDIVRENYGTVKKLIVKVYKKINNNNTIFEFWQHHPDLLVKH